MSHDVGFYRTNKTGPATQALADAKDSGRNVSGPEKLGQWFVTELLTKKGDIPGYDGGCEFLNRLESMSARTETDVFTALAASLNEVRNTITNVQTDEDPANEKLKKVRIERLEMSAGTLRLRLVIVSEADTQTKVEIPLDFLLQ